MTISPIAHFHSPFATKFGVPKQSGMVPELAGRVVFVPRWRDANLLRGLEGFDYVWLLWQFSANRHAARGPVVRPPVLGGNVRMGVLATRSPYRPNALGLSSVRLVRVEPDTADGPVLHVQGADLMDGTPIFDIKPYVEFADSHPGVRSGFATPATERRLRVELPEAVAAQFAPADREALRHTLALDPRPQYQDDPQKVYGMVFAGRDVHFTIADGVAHVLQE